MVYAQFAAQTNQRNQTTKLNESECMCVRDCESMYIRMYVSVCFCVSICIYVRVLVCVCVCVFWYMWVQKAVVLCPVCLSAVKTSKEAVVLISNIKEPARTLVVLSANTRNLSTLQTHIIPISQHYFVLQNSNWSLPLVSVTLYHNQRAKKRKRKKKERKEGILIIMCEVCWCTRNWDFVGHGRTVSLCC